MLTLEEIRLNVIAEALQLLPSKMSGSRDKTDVLLLATHLQESPQQLQRQVGGPAVGIWQFERNGGIKGVLTHRTTAEAAHVACKALGLDMSGSLEARCRVVYDALQTTDDVLDAVFARLLYWTDATKLPEITDEEGCFQYYLRNWRPGAWTNGTPEARKKLRDKWAKNFAKATEVVVG